MLEYSPTCYKDFSLNSFMIEKDIGEEIIMKLKELINILEKLKNAKSNSIKSDN